MEVKNDNFIALKTFTKAEATFDIGGKEFAMKPLVPKKLRELVQLIEASGNGLSGDKGFNASIEFVLARMVDIFPIVFNATVDQEFIDNNMSIPLCLEIWEQFIKLNRLEGILPFLQRAFRVRERAAAPEVPGNQTES